MKQRFSSGQVVLITLLVLTIATTVALSLIARTTTDTTITNQVEESSKAFSAAEAGVEEALKTGNPSTQVLSSGVSYNVNVGSVGGATGVYAFPKITQKGTTETLWLVEHNQTTGALDETTPYRGSSIDVCWSSGDVIPALLVTILYKDHISQTYRVVKQAYDPDPVRAATDKFSSTYIPGGCSDTNTTYKETITFAPAIDPANDTLIALRIRPLFNDTRIEIDSGDIQLAKQGDRIESTGTTTEGINRKIIVYQQYRAPASVFDAALYSENSLSY